MRKLKVCNILIVIEHAARELEMACLIKHLLTKRGYTVEIESVLPIKERLIFEYKADIILVPWWKKKHDNQYWESFRFNNNKVVFINLNQETYTAGKNVAIIPNLGREGVYQLSWGNAFSEALYKKNVAKSFVLQTGSIRLDFYHEKFSQSFTKSKSSLSEEFGLDIQKRWILYIASPRHLFSKKEQAGEYATDAVIECRNKFLAFIDNYLKINTDVLIIYRPHPNLAWKEKLRPEIQDLIQKYPNSFTCIENYSIRDWIMNSSLCISVNSTSFVECIRAKKPYILYLPSHISMDDSYAWFRDFPYVVKKDSELVNYLNNEFDYNIRECEDILGKYYDYSTDILAAEKLCDFIEQLHKKRDDIAYNIPYRYVYRNALVLFLKKSFSILAKFKLVNKVFLKFNYKPLLNISIENEAANAIKNEASDILKKLDDIEI